MPFEHTAKADKSDVLGIIDYIYNGLNEYVNNPSGRPYDDDEIIEIENWVKRSIAWLYEKAEEMS